MYPTLLLIHSWLRWAVVALLLASVASSGYALAGPKTYTRRDARLRSLLATASHVQLLLGITLYLVSPVVAAFRAQGEGGAFEGEFFGEIHPFLMLVGVVVITLAGSFSKRAASPAAMHKTNLAFLAAAVLLIFAAIPWQGSPLVSRPLFR